ncbi:MAG TPA: NAD-binding protein [Anaerolineae bacterium]|nr:NAD-binding protein [Anaerolineae bacterium]
MFVMIVGGGRAGSHLATLLLELGHKVRLIEDRPQVVEQLHRELPTEVIHVGNPLDTRVLELAGIDQAQVLVAATDDDGINLSVAFLGKFEFEVPRVIGRVNNPRYAWLFRPEIGVDVSLDQTDILARLIEEQMSLGDMMPLIKLRRGKYSLVEQKVPPGAAVLGTMLKDLDLPDHCVIAAIIRNGQVVVPRGVTTFEVMDEVLAVVDREAADHLAALFEPGEPSNEEPTPSSEESML